MQGTVFGSGKCGFLNGLGIGGMRMAHTGQILGGSTEFHGRNRFGYLVGSTRPYHVCAQNFIRVGMG